MREVYPASKWNYGLVYDTSDPGASFTVEVADEIPLQPLTTANAPVVLKVTGQEISQWKLRGNMVPEPPYSPIKAEESLQTKVELIPYGCGRIRVTQMPFIGEAQGTMVRTFDSAKVTEEDGERTVEFANVVVPSAEDYTLKISYTGAGKLRLRLNSQYNQELTFSEGGEPLVIENLIDLLPGVFGRRLNQMMKGYKFDYGQFNNIRFYGNDDVEIIRIGVIPVNPFTTPEIIIA